jgi:CDP-paratose 2-epimerase
MNKLREGNNGINDASIGGSVQSNIDSFLPAPRLESSVQKVGLLEWFRPGEYDHVEQVLDDLHNLGVTELRTGISWADYHTTAGEEWYSWMIPRLAGEVNLLPCFLYTPPSLGISPKTSSPPRDPKAYADFLDVMITRFGKYFDWVELWNEPMNLSEWDWTMDRV